MKIVHVSAESYPMAKVGGLADVVGALPKYQMKNGLDVMVVMPKYNTKFLTQNQWEIVHKSVSNLDKWFFNYEIVKLKNSNTHLGYPLYLIDIPELFSREKIYGYHDDVERFVAFQIACCHWILQWTENPNIIHCHDNQAALVPFIAKHGLGFRKLQNIKFVLTIHNGQYQGNFSWEKSVIIPQWDDWKTGLLEWNNQINSLACGIKCADKVTTVSQNYLYEMTYNSNGLEKLINYELGKFKGIINGIDLNEWNPETDQFLPVHFSAQKLTNKLKMKQIFCQEYELDPEKPLIIFIGRFVYEKAADLIPEAIYQALANFNNSFNMFIIGSGENYIENQVKEISYWKANNVKNWIGYNEKIGRWAYAAADFLLMPSRIEPCGLNQLYSLRYGTIPIVRSTGGLKDTIIDYGDEGGFGITFLHASVSDIVFSIGRALSLFYKQKEKYLIIQKYIMTIDNSWEKIVKHYQEIYDNI